MPGLVVWGPGPVDGQVVDGQRVGRRGSQDGAWVTGWRYKESWARCNGCGDLCTMGKKKVVLCGVRRR